MLTKDLALELQWFCHNTIVHPSIGAICFVGWAIQQKNSYIGQGLINLGSALHDILTPSEHPKEHVDSEERSNVHPLRRQSVQ